MQPQIRIPRIETAVIINGSSAILDGEIFRINDEMKSIVESQSCKTTDYLESVSGHNIVSVDEEEIVGCMDNEFVEEIIYEKTFEDYYTEYFHLFGELEKVSVQIPLMRIGELKDGIPVVRVENEVFRVCKETKEVIEKNNYSHPVNAEPVSKKRPAEVKNEFNSSSVFFEKRQKIIDRAYFHVISTEINGDNEICLSGVFVEEKS